MLESLKMMMAGAGITGMPHIKQEGIESLCSTQADVCSSNAVSCYTRAATCTRDWAAFCTQSGSTAAVCNVAPAAVCTSYAAGC